MDDLLSEVSTSFRTAKGSDREFLVEVKNEPAAPTPPSSSAASPKSPEEALQVLRNQPNVDALRKALEFLVHDPSRGGSKLASPSPVNSQIVNALVSDVVPSYWAVSEIGARSEQSKKRKDGETVGELLLRCLRNVAGCNAILLRLKAYVRLAHEHSSKKEAAQDVPQGIRELLDFLGALLTDNNSIDQVYDELQSLDALKRRAMWKEFVGLAGGSRILEVAAEATSVMNASSKSVEEPLWISDSRRYSKWLGQTIAWSAQHQRYGDEGWRDLAELLRKSLRLGYADTILEPLFLCLQSGETDDFASLQNNLSNLEQKTMLVSGLRFLSTKYLTTSQYDESEAWWRADTKIVGGAARFLTLLLQKDVTRREQLVSWLTSASGAGVGEGIGVRRAAITAVSANRVDLESVLEKTMQQFGEQLYINHAPTLQQEAHAQVLLLAAGLVQRQTPMRLSMLLRSGAHLSGVTNRLASSSSTARFLGMVVAETLSSLVDAPDKRMDFKVSEMQSSEAKWYNSLVTVQDTVGSLADLPVAQKKLTAPKPTKLKPANTYAPRPRAKPAQQGGSKIIAIEEVSDSDTDMDSGELQTYAKPDSDAEDSEDDPTLIQRKKAEAPVYIRDLITYLRDTDNYDRQKLAVATAPSLIRRKANFGTEVSAHAEELATLLVGLQDKFELEHFQELRLQGMMAILAAQPGTMSPWFAKTFFEGDLSVSQRATILTAIGLAARELAGFKDSAELLTPNASKLLPTTPDFPSKYLPPKLHAIYAAQSQPKQLTPVDSISKQLSDVMLQPIVETVASAAASSASTSPAMLQLRQAKETRKTTPRPPRPPARTNAFGPLAGPAFLFPLTARTLVAMRSPAARQQIILAPHLLPMLLRTLALVLHAAGPTTPALPQMTAELWTVLLALRARAARDADKSVLAALCFALLTLLQVNGARDADQRRLAETHGRELVETRAWVEGVLRELGAGEEEEQVRVLAAGILVGIGEIVEKYQRLLMGDLVGF